MYENLVFEGGGTKGLVYIGAARALEANNILPRISRFAGSSIGALVAACLSLGFTSTDLEQVLLQYLQPIRDLMEIPSVLEMLLRLQSTCGIFDIAALREIVVKVLAHKVDPTLSLRQHHDLTGKDLVLVSTDLTHGQYLYFYYQQYPDTLLVDALVACMAIPLVFTPFKLATGVMVGDAGMFANNYPVWVFNDLSQLLTGKFVRAVTVVPETLGIRVLTTEEMPDHFRRKSTIRNLLDYALAWWKSLNTISDRFENSESITQASVLIECNQFALAFPADWRALVRQGEVTTSLWLEKHESSSTDRMTNL